jgi:APA family basic amino acid/polyamine antiporter
MRPAAFGSNADIARRRVDLGQESAIVDGLRSVAVQKTRLTFSMARDGEIHGIFADVLPRRQTPVAAILSLIMAAALLPIGSIKILAEMSSFAALVAFLTVNLALITLRYAHPHHLRPFRVPGAIGRMPVLPLAAIASIILLLIHFD